MESPLVESRGETTSDKKTDIAEGPDELTSALGHLSIAARTGSPEGELCSVLNALAIRPGKKIPEACIATAETWISFEDK